MVLALLTRIGSLTVHSHASSSSDLNSISFFLFFFLLLLISSVSFLYKYPIKMNSTRSSSVDVHANGYDECLSWTCPSPRYNTNDANISTAPRADPSQVQSQYHSKMRGYGALLRTMVMASSNVSWVALVPGSRRNPMRSRTGSNSTIIPRLLEPLNWYPPLSSHFLGFLDRIVNLGGMHWYLSHWRLAWIISYVAYNSPKTIYLPTYLPPTLHWLENGRFSGGETFKWSTAVRSSTINRGPRANILHILYFYLFFNY